MARPQGGAAASRANDAVTKAQLEAALATLFTASNVAPDPANPQGYKFYLFMDETNKKIVTYKWVP